MTDLPPDLGRLRVLETYLRLQLDQVRAAIAAAEQPAGPPADAETPWWRLESAPAPGQHFAVLHRGDCPLVRDDMVAISRRNATLALQDVHADKTRTAAPCPRCKPDLGLGTDTP